jgi:translin
LKNLDSISEQIRKSLSAKDAAREKMLPLCRDSIRCSSNAIRAVHRREFEQAEELLGSARSLLTGAEQAVQDNGELISTGLVRDAQKELAEANITLALVTGKPLPEPVELGVDSAAYLNGLGEAAGEIRRYLLDSMRQGDLSRGDELLSVMDEIYGVLVTMDYPDAITGGLRRTTDMVRGVLERTRSDLTLAVRQKQLENRLEGLKTEDISAVQPEETVQQEEAIEQEEIPDVQPEDPVLDRNEMDIYNALSEWREHRASEENLSPYIIARNSWLKEIVKMNPSDLRDLMGIKGFGERRANKYGKDIIAIIKNRNS